MGKEIRDSLLDVCFAASGSGLLGTVASPSGAPLGWASGVSVNYPALIQRPDTWMHSTELSTNSEVWDGLRRTHVNAVYI